MTPLFEFATAHICSIPPNRRGEHPANKNVSWRNANDYYTRPRKEKSRSERPLFPEKLCADITFLCADQDVKQQTRNLLEARELERKMNRVDQYALGAELGSRMGDLRRARSFGSYGMAGMREKLALEAEVSRARQVRELEADRLRGERIRQESEFIHRVSPTPPLSDSKD